MDDRLSRLLDEIYAEGRKHDGAATDRLRRWRNLEPETANLLYVLIQALAPRRLLEVGTSNGYSTIWLTAAGSAAGAETIMSIEILAERSELARENLRQAGLDPHIELRVGDAAELLARSGDKSWDFIFLDAERPAYPQYWPDLRRVLAPRGVLAVDNAISHADELAAFRTLVNADETMSDSLVPIGAGLLLIVHG